METFVAGPILILSLVESDPENMSLYAIELDAANTSHRILRRLNNQPHVDAFIKDRQESYALMWGSCCAGKIDCKDAFIRLQKIYIIILMHYMIRLFKVLEKQWVVLKGG